ncbi:hypothetical protein JTE90_010708 [Oedothorax gibbosus]|uniref:SPK domain-containing protein n=1 Tax=Oedothorax gibbosus TaxID=931172 RepID=A0AAV6UQJ5_9ARAC|nr:hypothetical protein JTE90_010708 [Oedothorax gibbosus]
MAGLSGDQDNGYSSLENENDAGPTQQTPTEVIDAALTRLRARANCEKDSFVRHLSTSLLSRMARNIFRRWESTRNAAGVERVPDFLELAALVCGELGQFAQRIEIAEEFERRTSRGSLEHDELEEQRRRERGDYRRSPRRRLSHSISTEDPTLDLDILQPVRIRSSPRDSPMSPMRGMADPEEMRSYQRTERVRVHRRRHSKHIVKEAEREERRRLRRSRDSVESSKSVDSLEVSMSPKKDIVELERSGENVSDPQQKFDTSSLNSESVEELHSSGDAKVSDDLEKKPKNSIITKVAAGIEDTLQSSVEETSPEYPDMKSLESSISSLSFDSPSDFQCSEASTTSEFSKNDMEQNSELPPTESGTSISSEVGQVGKVQKPEVSHPRTERNITPNESSAPSDELPTNIENPPTDDAHNTGARPKASQKDEERRKKRTRQVVESFTTRQIINLILLEISPTDGLELLIQLTVSLDRLDRLINGSRNGGSDIVNESVLAQFFEALEYCRTQVEMDIGAEEGLDETQSSSVPEIPEHPRRDPQANA